MNGEGPRPRGPFGGEVLEEPHLKMNFEFKITSIGIALGLNLLWMGMRVHAFPVVEPSISPPGGLLPSQIPQIVLIAFDDSVASASCARAQAVLTNHINPNGKPIKATFFVSLDGKTDYALIQNLYAAGNEIAVHTMSHTTDTNTSTDVWRKELVGCRKAISELAQIPRDEIVGFRAPYLLPNDNAFQVLQERGFLYDSSFPEDASRLSPSNSAMIWPYTLHNGLVQNASSNRIPVSPYYTNIFEIPLWCLFSPSQTVVTAMDPPPEFTSNEVAALWKTNFLAHYEGNRAPFGLDLHGVSSNQWLSSPVDGDWRRATVNEFIEWALTFSNVYFITYRDMLNFQQAPVTIDQAPTSTPFLTPIRTAWTNPQPCSYPNWSTRVCGSCPTAWPTVSNVFYHLTPLPGGSASFLIRSQDVSYTYAQFTISNNTSETVYDWSFGFTLSTGTVSALYDGPYTQGNRRVWVHLAPGYQYNAILPPGAAYTISFRVNSTNVTFSPDSPAFSTAGPTPTATDIRVGDMPGELSLKWVETALAFTVEYATNLASIPIVWTVATNSYYRTNWIGNISDYTSPVFFRIKGQ